jgi:RHS repeat-associated protein
MEVDQNAKVLSYEEYTPYGMSSLRSTHHQTEAPKRYRFLGKEQDDSGLYHLGARYYAAWLGRFTSADPKGAGDGLNLYQYAQSNPVMLTDPGGTAAGPVDPKSGWNQKILDQRAGLVKRAQDAAGLAREAWKARIGALNNVYGTRAAKDFALYLQKEYGLGHVEFKKYLPGAGGGTAGSSKLDMFFREWGIAVEHKLVSVGRIFKKSGEFRKRGEEIFKQVVGDISEQASTRAVNIQRAGEDIVSVLGVTIKGVEKDGAQAKAFVTKLLEHLPSSVKQGIEIIHEMHVPLAAAREELNVAAKVLGGAKDLLGGAAKVARRVGGPVAVLGLVVVGIMGMTSDAKRPRAARRAAKAGRRSL